jgi:hypothetical protein
MTLLRWSAWRRAARRAWVSGSMASLTSATALAVLGRREAGSAAAPVNAVSHWYFGERAARQDGVSLKYTLNGYLTHHAAAVFWAVIYERLFERRAWPRQVAPLVPAAAVATLAAVVDYTVTPKRLTPGYEKRLSVPALFVVYGAFAVGLALGRGARAMAR